MRNFKKLFFSLNFLYLILIAAQVAAIIFLCFCLPALLPLALFSLLSWALNFGAACLIFLKKGAPDDACAYFLAIAALPVFGAILCVVLSSKRKAFGDIRLDGEKSSGLFKAVNELCGSVPASFTDGRYYFDGAQFLDALFKEISRAKKEVLLEYYIISRGKIFESLLSALKTAAANGARIEIIVDGVGSAFGLKRRERRELESLGARVLVFHKLTPLARARINLRDHRKIAVVDGETAFIGGVNIGDEYANLVQPYGFWKDSGVSFRGDAAKELEVFFKARAGEELPDFKPQVGGQISLPFYDEPPNIRTFESVLVNMISKADKRVHVTTPYFCPSEGVCECLKFAVRRGVDVKVIIPHLPDKKYAFAITKHYVACLAECGVQFFEYTPGFMHAKAVICDDEVVLGSYNFDFRSMRYNAECGAIFGGEICVEAERDFFECLALCKATRGKKSNLIALFSPLA